MSSRLLKDELRRRTLKPLRMPGWPLARAIHVVRLRGAHPFRPVQHLLDLAATKIPELQLTREERNSVAAS